MTEIARILDQFCRAYNGDAWYGEPIRAILAGISAENAAKKILANAHSIWEILLHIIAWEGEVLRRLRTGIMQLPEEGDWQEVQNHSEEAWKATFERFERVHADLEQQIATINDEQLPTILGAKRERETGAGVSYYVLLHGIVQHGIYHAGQIALLKKAFEA